MWTPVPATSLTQFVSCDRASDRFYKTIVARINANLPASFYLQMLNNWLGVRLVSALQTRLTRAQA